MVVIPNPRSGDPFVNLMLVSGITEETMQLMSRDIQMYNRSLSRAEQKERLRIFRKAKEEYCR